MSLSNYPPGVSGNEPQIAGPRAEGSHHRECDQDCSYVPKPIIDGYLQVLRFGIQMPSNPFDVQKWLDTLRGEIKEHEAEFACDWSGDIDVESVNGVLMWTCPRCGHDHEEEPEDTRDPDLAWKERYE